MCLPRHSVARGVAAALIAAGTCEAGSTRLVRDIHRGTGTPRGTYPALLTVHQRSLFFVGADPVNGRELWLSDGSPEGTRLVRDIAPGLGDGPWELTSAGQNLYFRACRFEDGCELWKSDGSPGGTQRVVDIGPGPEDGYPAHLRASDQTLIFIAFGGDAGVWRSDGTEQGTFRLMGLMAAGPYAEVASGIYYFVGDDGASGMELWRSDGSVPGTSRVADINPGQGSSNPTDLVAHQGRLYFVADDGTHGRQLWTADGSAAGTQRLTGFPPEVGCPVCPLMAAPLGDALYFIAQSGALGPELWKTDGSAAGTVMTGDLRSLGLSYVRELAGAAGSLFLADQALWRSDGTTLGTRVVPGLTTPRWLTGIGDVLYFVASDPEHGEEPWRSDGSPEGTFLLADTLLGQGSVGADPAFVGFGGRVFFSRDTLWETDGTPGGTRRVDSPRATPNSSFPRWFVPVGRNRVKGLSTLIS